MGEPWDMRTEPISTGCTTAWLSGFPYDTEDAYSQKKLDELDKELNQKLPASLEGYTRTWLVTLCSQQLNAKAVLEKHGFRVLASSPSGHKEIPKPKTCANGGTVYLMGKGWDK